MLDTLTLDQTQRWLQAIVSHPDGAAGGIAAAEAGADGTCAPAAVEAVVLPSQSLTAAERVGVYANMYFSRLTEVLEKDYAAVRYAAGEQGFHTLAQAYTVAHPSRHYSLNVFGAHFPAFLRDTTVAVEHRHCLAELATLEWAVQVVFDAPRAEALSPDDVLQVSQDEWETRRLALTPAYRLLEFAYPVNAFLQAFREQQAPTLPDAESRTRVLVYRKQYQVRREELDPAQYALLRALEAGTPVADALAAAAEAPGADPAVILENVGGWFRRWAAAGLFIAGGSRH